MNVGQSTFSSPKENLLRGRNGGRPRFNKTSVDRRLLCEKITRKNMLEILPRHLFPSVELKMLYLRLPFEMTEHPNYWQKGWKWSSLALIKPTPCAQAPLVKQRPSWILKKQTVCLKFMHDDIFLYYCLESWVNRMIRRFSEWNKTPKPAWLDSGTTRTFREHCSIRMDSPCFFLHLIRFSP